ncbi:MAG TPA: phosphodiester glycosidase family protein [bacterium]|jgi:uncharacterized protein YigE (DUF2233 family)|nr:phosphodiester glycosidase family protein [bacterium]
MRIAVTLTLLLLALSGLTRPAPAAPPARVLDLGWTTQDRAIKVVAHLDRAVRFRATTSSDRLVVDLWPVGDAATRELAVNAGGVGVVRQQPLEGGIARLSISLQGATRYKVFSRADPHKLAVVILPPWRAMVPLPSSLSYRRLRVLTGGGWTNAHAVLVDLTDPRISLRPALGGGTFAGAEPTAAVATRHDAFAAINGGFFARKTGQPLGLVVIDGRLLSTPIERRAVFAITAEGRPTIQPFTFRGSVESDLGTRIPISAVNRPPRWGGLAVYTPEYGPLTPTHTLHAVVVNGTVTAFPTGRVAIPDDGYVLSATVAERRLISDRLVLGQQVRLDLAISPGKIVHAIGGGPRLVQDGRISVPFRWESFGEAFSSRRTSRSAIGITAAGKVLLVTVEKSRGSTGMRLIELARLMREMGAVQAMNLDGGGSSTLVVGGRVVNVPERGQRGVASMLLVVPKPSE